ncbi:glycoside hydrolase family 57 protein [Candidatus Woesearchaeota archaeon]|nr:glycoside hydrolase family 57 protein [Candidatus Woesearchaeota archaeon]
MREQHKPRITFYFQVHQPYRLRHYGVFEIGSHSQYFHEEKNKDIVQKVGKKCYLPTNRLMLYLLKKHPDFKISYSITGVALEQFEQYYPEVFESFKKLLRHERVEVLGETYYHSLSFLYSRKEFIEQVEMHRSIVKELFFKRPKTFRNTELIYSDELAKTVEELGFKTILAEGADHILGWRSPNYVYKARGADIKLLLKNYRLSDDIAFRFSNTNWEEYPLTAEKYAAWLNAVNGETINLFMDYETFGEHQWAETGIFRFMERLPDEVKKYGMGFATPTEISRLEAKDELSYPHYVSWADMERDLSAWLGNPLQDNAIQELYKLERYVKSLNDPEITAIWRKLQTSDHFYYMCTKWFSDGDVHKYFNPYDTPYEGFIAFMNVLNDLAILIGKKFKERIGDAADKLFQQDSRIVMTDKPSMLVSRIIK